MPTNPKQYKNMVSKWSQNPWKIGFRTQQKTMLKNRAQKTEKITKTDPKMAPEKWLYFGGNPTGAPLVVQTVFVMKKFAPNAPKVRPRTTNGPTYLKNKQNGARNSSKKSPESEKELQKLICFATKNDSWKFAGPWPSRRVRSRAMCFWNFDIDHFHWPQTFPIFRIILDFFCNRSQLKQKFELKPDLSQTSARFELNWAWPCYCYCLDSAPARRRPL